MGRILVNARLWNFDDDDDVRAGRVEPMERTCVVDTGATETVLPEGLVTKLGLKVFSSLVVRYASGKKAQRDLAGSLMVEIEGRQTLTRVIVEPGIRRPLIGPQVLESLDLVADCKNRRLAGNPEHPRTQMMEY